VPRGLVALVLVVAVSAGCGDNARLVDAAIDAEPDAPDRPRGVPDLQFMAGRMVDTVQTSFESFLADNCAVVEHCVNAEGPRRLLRFATVIANLGTGDLAVGEPPLPGENNQWFVWSQCHMHHHFVNFASYELYDRAGHMVTGRKQAFCLEDDEAVPPIIAPTRYSCLNQGISRRWADVYGAGLPCQFIDTTGLPSGQYTLRVVVNPNSDLTETDYTNNVFTKIVTF